MMAMRDWRARLGTGAFISVLLLASIGCGGYTLIDQTAETSPAWVQSKPPAKETHTAHDKGGAVMPRADDQPAATAETPPVEPGQPAADAAHVGEPLKNAESPPEELP